MENRITKGDHETLTKETKLQEGIMAKDIHDYRKIFPNGTLVTHVLGGQGRIKTLENEWNDEWSTHQPTVIALVQTSGIVPRISRIPITELEKVLEEKVLEEKVLEEKVLEETLENWKRETLDFKEDIKGMSGIEPVLEILDRLLSVIQELQNQEKSL